MFFAVKEKTIFDAHELYLSGKYDKALMVCEEILARNPESYSALNIIANIYFIKNDFDKGEAYIYKLKDLFVQMKDYNKAIGVLHRLVSMKPERERYHRDIAEIYHKSGREKHRVREMLLVAENYRRDGKFKRCAEIYMEISGFYEDNPELDKFLVKKLTLIGATDQLAKIADKNYNKGFSKDEIDDIVLVCAEHDCRPESFIKYIPDFLDGTKGRLKFVEDLLYNYLSKSFDEELLKQIIENTDDGELLLFLEKLRDISNSPIITKTLIKLESLKNNRDRIKGYIFELYINSALDMYEIYDICCDTGNYIAYEEAFKVLFQEMSDAEKMSRLDDLGKLYARFEQGEKDRFTNVYIDTNTFPENFVGFISNPLSCCEEIEKLSVGLFSSEEKTSTSKEDTEIEVHTEISEESATEDTEEKLTSIKPDDDSGFIIESHMAEDDSEEPAIQEIELDSFDEDSGEVSVDTSIELEPLVEEGEAAVDTSVSGLETFEQDDDLSAEPEEKLIGAEHFQPEDAQPNKETMEDPFEISEENSKDPFAAFDVSGDEDKQDIFAAFSTESEKYEEPDKDIFAGTDEQKKTEPEKEVKQIDMSDVEIPEKKEEKEEKEDIFEGYEQGQKTEQKKVSKKIDIDEDEIKPSDTKGKDIFDMEV